MKVFLENIKVGMCVGQDLYTESGQLITPGNTIVTSDIILKLKRFNITTIEVIPDPFEFPTFDVKSTEKFKTFRGKYEETQKSLTSSLDGLLEKGSGSSQVSIIKALSSTLYDSNAKNLDLMDMIYNMQEHSDIVYTHSMNVGMIAGRLGRWLNFPDDEVQLLITCGLFHDIGKLLIPAEILDKSETLTPAELEIVHSHAAKGFELLEKFDSLDPRIKAVALSHHERCDGTGYPMHLQDSQIDKFSEVIAIADAYEAMTSERSYRSPICPFIVAAYFENEGLHKFNTGYILKFLDKMLVSYLHSEVRLSNGQVAKVVMINKAIKSKPLVALDDGTFLDLSKNLDVSIVEMIN